MTRLDRLGRSLKELLETVENLKDQDIGLISLEERIDTTSAAGELIFMSSEPSRILSAASSQNAQKAASKPPERKAENQVDRLSKPKPSWLSKTWSRQE